MEANCTDCVHSLKPWDEKPCKPCIEASQRDGSRPYFRLKVETKEAEEHDPVNQPSHYMLKPGLEVRDVLSLLADKIDSNLSLRVPSDPLFTSDYVQMMQYLMRFMDKNGKQDLEKARWYLDKMIEAYGDS